MGRIERAPSWILEYKERIEKGVITAEDILEAENKVRETPIKISSVTRAINAMGYPTTGLRREKKEGEGAEEGKKGDNIKEVIKDQGPGWLQKYRNRIEKGTIQINDILEAENKIREVPIKITTALRAINIMGYPVTDMQKGKGIEAEVKEEKLVEKKEVPGRGPDWVQKYRNEIEKGTITVEDIRGAESRLRAMPIKISTVTRAINTMGYPITELRRGTKIEVEVKEKKLVEKKEGPGKGPGWLQKYRDGIEKGTITVEGIMEAENRIRAEPIKISTVTRAINTMGYPITGLRRGTEDEERKKEKRKKTVGVAEEVAYSSSIEKISKATEKRFIATKKSWEEYLDKSLQNDYFMNLLLVLAKLLEHGKTLAPAKK